MSKTDMEHVKKSRCNPILVISIRTEILNIILANSSILTYKGILLFIQF